MRAQIRGTDIFFDVDGASHVVEGGRVVERPTAFLVHGGPGVDHIGWKKGAYPRLREKLQLVYFDMRGHGLSGRCHPSTYTLDENVEDMEALRRHLGLEKIVSIGASYGGRVAMAHAARYPDSVSHLVLLVTSANPAESGRQASEYVAAHGTPEQIQLCDDLHAGRLDTPEKMRRYYEVTASLYARRPDVVAGVGMISTLTPEPQNTAFGPEGYLWTLDLRPELSCIKARTLILAGRHDWRCAPEFSEEMHRLISGSELRIFEESGHSIGGDEPEKLLDAVAGFLVYNDGPRPQ